MKVITEGKLGSFHGASDGSTPKNGELFADMRLNDCGQPYRLLVAVCHNCGDYFHITEEQTNEFIRLL